MDSQLQKILAATCFGGPYGPGVASMAIDAAGNIYIGGGTPPRGLPTRTPLFGVYQITVYVPIFAAINPDLKNYVFPPLLSLVLQIAGVTSQSGLSISIQ